MPQTHSEVVDVVVPVVSGGQAGGVHFTRLLLSTYLHKMYIFILEQCKKKQYSPQIKDQIDFDLWTNWPFPL